MAAIASEVLADAKPLVTADVSPTRRSLSCQAMAVVAQRSQRERNAQGFPIEKRAAGLTARHEAASPVANSPSNATAMSNGAKPPCGERSLPLRLSSEEVTDSEIATCEHCDAHWHGRGHGHGRSFSGFDSLLLIREGAES